MRRGFVTLGAVVALLGFAAIGSTAGAQPPPEVPGAAVAAAHQHVVDYWTPDRQAGAVEREARGPNPNAKPGGGGAGGAGGGGGGSVTGATWTGGGAVVRTTGKVFFTMGSFNYACSGSAVHSGQGSIVLTAGHCVHDLTDGWATNWMFIPAYTGPGSAPYGKWTATALFTTASWLGSENFDDDAGFAVVRDGTNSATLESSLGVAVPTIDFGSNVPLTDSHFAFGYPASKKYKGNTLTYCSGPIKQSFYDPPADTYSMSCDMTGGSSGGPWFETFTTTPKIMSLNSYGYASLQSVMFGPVFGSPEQDAFAAAADGACDSSENCVSSTT